MYSSSDLQPSPPSLSLPPPIHAPPPPPLPGSVVHPEQLRLNLQHIQANVDPPPEAALGLATSMDRCVCVRVCARLHACVRACVRVLTVTPWCIVCGAIVADVLCLERGAMDIVCSASHKTIEFAVLMCGSELSVPVPLDDCCATPSFACMENGKVH